MRCSVPGCKNDSRQSSKSKGITFHVFPAEKYLRRAWLKAIGREGWEPKERSGVCSTHFVPGDLYRTQNGLTKVRSGAVPIAVQDILNIEYTDPENVPVCRICLATDCRLYNLKSYDLEDAFQTITGLILQEEDKLPQKLCSVCARSLDNCVKFRDKSLRADTLLNELVKQYDILTLQSIKLIDRQSHELNTNLTIKHFEPDHYDFNVEETESKIPKLLTEVVEVKNESADEIFLNENDEFDNDDDKKDIVAEDVSPQDVIDTATIIIPPKDEDSESSDHGDHDFSTSDKDSLSGDSLSSVEVKKTKKKASIRKKPNPEAEALLRKVANRKRQKKEPKPKVDRRRKPFLNADMNETLFTVTHLTREEQIADIEKRRESTNYKNATFKCTECFKGFLDGDAYTTHMSRHTKQSGDFRCDICKCHFKHTHALRKHITAHHTQRFSCKECSYVTTHRQTARLHERWHKGTKYQCPHCPDEFVKFTTYMGHIRIKHPSDFVCSLCGFSFVSEKGIELHKKLKHRLDKKEVPEDGPLCELCNVRFISTDALQQHIRVSTRHSTSDKNARESNKPKQGRKSKEAKERERKLREGLLDLGVDDKRVLYPSQLRKAEGPIPCEQCGLQLADSRAYHGHFRRMHPDKNRTKYPSMKSPCMCEVCGRIFQSFALLRDHRWVHTGERPFKCDQCDKSFRMKQRLVAHKRVHSSEKSSYVCNLCGKHFSTQSNKQRHMFIHTGLKPFKCEMCGKSFKHSTEKRAHITYVHLKKPWPKRNRGKRRSESRQGIIPQQSVSNSGSELDLPPPLWPTEHKMDHIHNIADDKPVYYKI